MALAEAIERLERSYQAVLRLTPGTNAMLADLETAGRLRERYAATRFARLDDVLPGAALTGLAATLHDILRPLAEVVVFRHQPATQDTLSFGGRFHRVDAACAPGPDSRAKLEQLLDILGLTAFSVELGAKLTPLVRAIVGDVRYRRSYLYFYEDGDYIGAHDDSHVGHRVDVQFPITIDGVGGIRVLSDGLFRMHYDMPGAMNILGPSMWHDVPPVLALSGAPPRRVNLGFRFTPE